MKLYQYAVGICLISLGISLSASLATQSLEKAQSTILRNNNLPNQQNREEWVREFVEIYGAGLTDQAKRDAIKKLTEFFQEVDLEHDLYNMTIV